MTRMRCDAVNADLPVLFCGCQLECCQLIPRRHEEVAPKQTPIMRAPVLENVGGPTKVGWLGSGRLAPS
jgi:hypothetical protein